MGKSDFLSPKAIANRIKSKGLQKLRWYCQMCQKQCRDEVSGSGWPRPLHRLGALSGAVFPSPAQSAALLLHEKWSQTSTHLQLMMYN